MPDTDHDSASAAPSPDSPGSPAAGRADDRYGVARAARVTRVAAIVLGVVIAVALVLGIFGWWRGSSTPITWTDLGYEHVDDHTTAAEFQVSMDPGTTGVCRVQAQNESHGQVGYLEVPVGPSEERYHAYRVEITTQEPAVSASVMGCTPTE